MEELKWRCIGKSVKGASHVGSGLPNQDAIKWYPESGIGPPVILAVSDGHGSAKSFRSDRGSQIAVETAIRVIQEFFLTKEVSDDELKNLKDTAERLLPQRIVNEWRDTVEQKLKENPLTDEEKQILTEKDGDVALKAVENNNFLAYGATLLAVLVTESFIVYIQLGDGDILQVDSKGNITRPLERDPKLIANETTSLCINKAWNEFQVHIELYPKVTPKEMPALILVATDGYSNSFSTDEGFFKIGQDYRQMFKSNLAEDIGHQLEGFLEETSEKGSGDDITLGMIKRLEKYDRDYIEDVDRRVEETRESVMRQQEESLRLESQVNDLKQEQNKTKKAVYWGFIWGFSLIMGSFLISIAFSSYLFFRLNGVEKAVEELKQQNGSNQDQSLPANNTTNTASPTPEATPTQTPTPSPTSSESPTPTTNN